VAPRSAEARADRDAARRGAGRPTVADQQFLGEEAIDSLELVGGDAGGLLVGLGPAAGPGLGRAGGIRRIAGAMGLGLGRERPIEFGAGLLLGAIGPDRQDGGGGRGQQ
jgi:hypothetical protein